MMLWRPTVNVLDMCNGQLRPAQMHQLQNVLGTSQLPSGQVLIA